MSPIRLGLAANDNRSRYLFDQLRSRVIHTEEFEFDRIPSWLRASAGALSWRPSKPEWWLTYQMHPLVQGQRGRVLRGSMRAGGTVDALLMWGSWFHPRVNIPYFNFIDQSLSLAPVEGEPGGRYVNRRRAHQLQGETYRDTGAIFCYSEWGRAQTLDAYPWLDPARVRAVGWGPCGVDMSDEIIHRTETPPIVLHVSNDFHRKGIDFLVATAAKVRQHIPEARFIVIGHDHGGLSPLPTGGGIEYVGPVFDKALLAEYFRSATVYFSPHRFDRSPHVLVEAMSASLPFVTSAQGGALELAATGGGLALSVGDIDAYTDAVTRLLADREYGARLGKAGLTAVRDRYNWPAIADRVMSEMKLHLDATATAS